MNKKQNIALIVGEDICNLILKLEECLSCQLVNPIVHSLISYPIHPDVDQDAWEYMRKKGRDVKVEPP